MGKYLIISDFQKELGKSNKLIFRVRFLAKDGKRHLEYFSMKKSDYGLAKKLGLINFNKKGYGRYYDWKPIGGAKGIKGGVKKVDKITYNSKYMYAHSDGKIYSLPRYMEKYLPRKDYILFGYRES